MLQLISPLMNWRKCLLQVNEFQVLSLFAKKCRNIWGSVRHKPSAMFKKYSREHNKGIPLGFIQPSECRMAGEHIALLRLLRLRNALKSTVMSREFKDLRVFQDASAIIMDDEFWKFVFVMCRALYAPMRILRLADLKTPAMDKLYFYVLQTDRMLPKWLEDVESHASKFLTTATIDTMGAVHTAGLSDSESDSDDSANNDDSVSSNRSNVSGDSNDDFSNAMENAEGQNNAGNDTNGSLDER